MAWRGRTLLVAILALTPALNVFARSPAPTSPEDLGPETIDVSSYPEEYRKTYEKIFVPTFQFLGGMAKAVNSPIIELDPRLETAERREHPELFSDPAVARISADGWRKRVEEIYKRPICCNVCPRLDRAQAKDLWKFLVYDSLHRKTGQNARSWVMFRKSLLERFNEGKKES
jgi:hypothetical protein